VRAPASFRRSHGTSQPGGWCDVCCGPAWRERNTATTERGLSATCSALQCMGGHRGLNSKATNTALSAASQV
jgi:hypothetical protein